MVTMVGLEKTFSSALYDLIELEYDTVEIYKTAISLLDNVEFKNKLEEITSDHKRHIQEFSDILTRNHYPAPTGPDNIKKLLAKSTVILGGLVGDIAILKAIYMNANDMSTAYERILQYDEKLLNTKHFLQQALNDERRHHAWLQTVLYAEP